MVYLWYLTLTGCRLFVWTTLDGFHSTKISENFETGTNFLGKFLENLEILQFPENKQFNPKLPEESQTERKFPVRSCGNLLFSGNSGKCSGPFAVTENFWKLKPEFSSNGRSLLLLETFTTSYCLIFILLFHFLVVSVTVIFTAELTEANCFNRIWLWFRTNMCGCEFQSVNMQMLCTVFACMTWPDSTVCHKATRLAMSFIREVRLDSLNSVNCSFAVLEALHLEIWKRSAIIIKIPAVSPSPSIYNVETLKNCRHQCSSL